MPGIDEKAILTQAVKNLVLATDSPLCLDTSHIDALKAALRLYPGRALINSISAEEKTLEDRLRLAASYGAMFILLPITGSSLPRTALERQEIVRRVYAAAREHGFTRDDFMVDALAMASLLYTSPRTRDS